MLAERAGQMTVYVTDRASEEKPEQTKHWRDEGCPPEAPAPRFPRCTECPLPLCRYDDGQSFQQWARVSRYHKMVYFTVHWLSVQEVAKLFKVRERTVFRARERILGPETGSKCKWGHEKEGNSQWRQYKGNWWLQCLTCARNTEARRRQKRKERDGN